MGSIKASKVVGSGIVSKEVIRNWIERAKVCILQKGIPIIPAEFCSSFDDLEFLENSKDRANICGWSQITEKEIDSIGTCPLCGRETKVYGVKDFRIKRERVSNNA